MEDHDVGRRRHRQDNHKPQLVRIHDGINIGGLVLFGGAVVAAYLFRKAKAAASDKKHDSIIIADEQQQLTSDDTEGKQPEGAATTTKERTADETPKPTVNDSSPTFPALDERDGGSYHDKLTADEDNSNNDKEEEEEAEEDEEEVSNRKNRGSGEDGSQTSLCATFGSTYEGRERELDDISGGNSLHEDFEQEEEDENEKAGSPPELNPKEEVTMSVVAVDGIEIQKTYHHHDGVIIEEEDGYIEDNDMDGIENEESTTTTSSSSSSSRGGLEIETEKDEIEIWGGGGGSETCSTEDSNAEAVWPAESIESLAIALEDQMTRLKKSAQDGINNQINHLLNNSSNTNNSSCKSEIIHEEEEQEEETCSFEAIESTLLLEKPVMVNGQIAELISRRSWIFPMLMLLILALLLLTRRSVSTYQANAS